MRKNRNTMRPKGSVGPSLRYRPYVCYEHYQFRINNQDKMTKLEVILTLEVSKTIYVYVRIYIEMRSKVKHIVCYPITVNLQPTFTHQRTATNYSIN